MHDCQLSLDLSIVSFRAFDSQRRKSNQLELRISLVGELFISYEEHKVSLRGIKSATVWNFPKLNCRFPCEQGTFTMRYEGLSPVPRCTSLCTSLQKLELSVEYTFS